MSRSSPTWAKIAIRCSSCGAAATDMILPGVGPAFPPTISEPIEPLATVQLSGHGVLSGLARRLPDPGIRPLPTSARPLAPGAFSSRFFGNSVTSRLTLILAFWLALEPRQARAQPSDSIDVRPCGRRVAGIRRQIRLELDRRLPERRDHH